MHTLMVTFCIHTEFHRMALVINYCELKKIENTKMLLLLYISYNIMCYYNVKIVWANLPQLHAVAKMSAYRDLCQYYEKVSFTVTET